MKRFLIFAISMTFLLPSNFLPASANADYSDLSRPQIVNLSINPKVKFRNSRYSIEIEVDLSVRVKKNPISRVLIVWKSPVPSDQPCLTYSRGDFLAGGSQIDVSRLKEIPGLVNQAETTDGWKLLTYQTTLQVSGIANDGFKPCLGVGRVGLISLVNLAGRGFEIETPDYPRGAKGIFTTNVDYVKGNYGTSEYDEFQSNCPLAPTDWQLFRSDIRVPCTHNINWDNLSINGAFLVHLADEAKAAEKAAVEVRINAANKKYSVLSSEIDRLIKQYPSKKSEIELYKKKLALFERIDPINVENVELNLAGIESKLVAMSSIYGKIVNTITCTKGKLTKKVTDVTPKCPAGYKKK